jgi:xyloglucan-specific endo-beta-1,4-glucanase
MKSSVIFLAGVFVNLSVAQDLCEQYSYLANEGYEFNNNRWGQDLGSGDQCTHVDWTNSEGAGWHVDWSWSGGKDNVKTFPNSALQMKEKRLMSQISTMQSAAAWSYEGTDIRADVAYDLFTAADPSHDPSSGEYELMIW